MKKYNNNLIKVTNLKNGESRVFTKESYACEFIGCSTTGLVQVKSGSSLKYKDWKYEIIDGSDIKWKDINII